MTLLMRTGGVTKIILCGAHFYTYITAPFYAFFRISALMYTFTRGVEVGIPTRVDRFSNLKNCKFFWKKLKNCKYFWKNWRIANIFEKNWRVANILKKSTPSLGRVESAKTPIFSFVFETWKVANFLLKITTPLARVECAKTRKKVLSLGKQLRQGQTRYKDI